MLARLGAYTARGLTYRRIASNSIVWKCLRSLAIFLRSLKLAVFFRARRDRRSAIDRSVLVARTFSILVIRRQAASWSFRPRARLGTELSSSSDSDLEASGTDSLPSSFFSFGYISSTGCILSTSWASSSLNELNFLERRPAKSGFTLKWTECASKF